MERKSRAQLIGELVFKNAYTNICEIGISRGDTVKGVKAYLKDRKYHLANYYGIDPGIWGRENKLFRPDLEYLSLYSAFKYIEETSDVALAKIPNNIELVFVDGSHEPEQVKKDIVNYATKIKDGGIMVGDDYNDFTGAGIKAIVNEVIGPNNLNYQLDTRLESGKDNWLWWTYVRHDAWTNRPTFFQRDPKA